MSKLNPSRIERIRQLYEEASTLPEDVRSDFLKNRCLEDDLREEVEELLKNSSEMSGNFEQFADQAIRSPLSEIRKESESSQEPPPMGSSFADPEQAGEQIGPYQLIRLVGEGGFGTVWEAQQESPVRRRVAIKFLKIGMATKEIIRRFEAERQALAMMGHANIAQVYDAGATDSGRSFFVMEFVEGMPLTQFCDKYQLSLKKRLHVYNLICGAIQHAHQKGIVHRDLKPNNILVHYEDEETRLNPVLKIIDFGVAKVLRSTTSEHTMVTGLGQMIGTPAYMSPEQASFGTAIPDTRTDVYSLGILLYELLTGTLPFQDENFKDVSIMEIQRILQTKDPQRPSTRLTVLQDNHQDELQQIIKVRESDFKTLHRALYTDLDWVIIHCLEKDPERRYSTAHELLLDINRYLNSEALVAGPPSATYRISKLVKRHRRTALASTFVVLSFVIGFVGTILGLVQATKAQLAEAEQRQRAEERTSELELVTNFQQSVFERLVPEQIGAEIFRSMLQSYEELLVVENVGEDERNAKVSELRENLYQLNPTDLARQTFNDFVLKKSSQAISEQFADQPIVEAALRESLAQSFRQIGLINEAIQEQEKALELIRQNASGELFASELKLAEIFFEAKFYHKAQEIVQSVLKKSDEENAMKYSQSAKFKLGKIEYALQNHIVAESLINQALSGFKASLGDNHEITLEAELESILVKRHFDYDLGYNSLMIAGDPLIAKTLIPLNKAFLDKILPILGVDHPLVWKAQYNYVEALALWTHIAEENFDNRPSLEKSKLAKAQLLQIQNSQEKLLGAYHPKTLETRKTIVYLERGRTTETNPEENRVKLNTLKSILETELAIWGENHPSVLKTLLILVRIQESFGFPDEAIADLRRAIEVQKKLNKSPNVDLADLYLMLSQMVLYHYYDAEKSLRFAETCLEIGNSIGQNIPQNKLRNYQRRYIAGLMATKQLVKAENLAIEWDFQEELNNILLMQGRWKEVEKATLENLEFLKNKYGTARAHNLTWGYGLLETCYYVRGDLEKAHFYGKERLACQQMTSDEDPFKVTSGPDLACDLARMGFKDEAKKLAEVWLNSKERFLKTWPQMVDRSSVFPYFELNPYFAQEAWLLKTALLWYVLGEIEKSDAYIKEYFRLKDYLKTEADPGLKRKYDKIVESEWGKYSIWGIAELLAIKGYYEEAEWLFTRGGFTYRYYIDPEIIKFHYKNLIKIYQDWHEADPQGGHLSKIPQWQEEIDAIDREYAKWSTEE